MYCVSTAVAFFCWEGDSKQQCDRKAVQGRCTSGESWTIQAVLCGVSALRRLSLTQTTHQNSLTTACPNSLKKSFLVVVYLTAKTAVLFGQCPSLAVGSLFLFLRVKNIALTWEKLETKWEKARKSLLSLKVISFRLSSTFCCCLKCFLFDCYYTLCNNGVGF